jgi:DNA polymerase theta
VANTKTDLENFTKCTLLWAEKGCTFKFFVDNDVAVKKKQQPRREATDDPNILLDPMTACMEFLTEYEFIRLQLNDETNEMNYVATRLGQACLASSMPPGDGFFLFSELQKSRQCFVLESELHAIYLVTPYSVCSQIQEIDWIAFLDLWEKVPSAMRRVGELVGVKDSFLVRAMRGNCKLDYKAMQVHKR